MKRLLVILAAIAAFFCPNYAQAANDLTFDQVFGKEPPFGRMPSRIAWAPDGHAFTYVLASQDSRESLDVRIYDVRSHRSSVLIPALKLGTRGRIPLSVVWSPDSRRVGFVEGATLYGFDVAAHRQYTIAKPGGEPQWSPDGRRIAFSHEGNVWIVDANGGAVRQLTHGGNAAGAVLNGDLDWVYPEELDTHTPLQWSPDGTSIAYMRLDDRGVTPFPIVDYLKTDNAVDDERYPLAGERNPKVSLHEIEIRTGNDRLVYDGAPHDEYIPWFAYVPHSSDLTYEVLDRVQQHVRVERLRDRSAETLYRTQDPSWVDVVPKPAWLHGGGSYWILSDGNTRCLFFRDGNGRFRQLTHGTRIQSIEAALGDTNDVLVSAAYPTRRDLSLLRAGENGAVVSLTPGSGWHAADVSPDGAAFLETTSSLNDAPQQALVDTRSGRRTQTAAPSTSMAAAILPTEMLTVKDPNGIALDATMMKPPNFDPAKRYPVIVYVYGGPESPTTRNDRPNLYHQLLAQAGYIVFSVDGPESQIDSERNLRTIHENFGPAMLSGQETGARYLASLPYVDAKRIGIWGWSYGGYATIYTLEHSKLFAAGVAVAPVTDWHFYDSIYTERYMGLPKQHARDYDRSSDLLDAKALTQPLLINHGTGDDNVHMANSISMMQSFVVAGKSNVDFAVYPRQLHGISALADRRVLFRRMIDWWVAHMPPAAV